MNMSEIEGFCLNYTIANYDRVDTLSIYAKNVTEGLMPVSNFLTILFNIFTELVLWG